MKVDGDGLTIPFRLRVEGRRRGGRRGSHRDGNRGPMKMARAFCWSCTCVVGKTFFEMWRPYSWRISGHVHASAKKEGGSS